MLVQGRAGPCALSCHGHSTSECNHHRNFGKGSFLSGEASLIRKPLCSRVSMLIKKVQKCRIASQIPVRNEQDYRYAPVSLAWKSPKALSQPISWKLMKSGKRLAIGRLALTNWARCQGFNKLGGAKHPLMWMALQWSECSAPSTVVMALPQSPPGRLLTLSQNPPLAHSSQIHVCKSAAGTWYAAAGEDILIM